MPKYIVGHNMPGYMPNDTKPPPLFDDFEDAKQCLIEDINHTSWSVVDIPDELANFADSVSEVKEWTEPGEITIGNEVYWIMEAE